MKLYCDPISTTSRPVMLFIADHGLDVEFVHVDLMTGGHLDPDYLAINPNGLVPFLVDGDFALGESASILRYLANKAGAPAYPKDSKARARVDETLDWFNTQFHEYFCLFTCYPNMGVPHGLDPALGQALMAYGREHSVRWLELLDRRMLAGQPYVCGDEVSLADYLGASFVTLGEIAAFDLSPYPNIRAWLARLQAGRNWDATYAGFRGLVAAIRGGAGATEPALVAAE
ncbi:MAG TPA: glutathione S-transferase family protein [Phenylobacterium sp.]